MIKRFRHINESSHDQNFDKTLIIVELADDWRGIYHNGELITQGHSISWKYVISELIENEIDLAGYEIQKLIHIDDGKELEFCPEDDDKWGDPIITSLPPQLSEYISNLEEAGYGYKI